MESKEERAAAALVSYHETMNARPSSAMLTQRPHPRARMQAFYNSQRAYEDAKERSTNRHYSPKYDSKKFNILRGIQDERKVTNESLKRSNIGLDGLNR